MVADEWEGAQAATQGYAAIRATGADTANGFALLECTLPPYYAGAAQHLHRRTTEIVYIVRGTLACTLDDETSVAAAGSLILVQPGRSHRFWNPTSKPAVYLTLFSPPGAEAFAAALAAQPLNDDGGPVHSQWPAAHAAHHDHFPV